jgi:hypothetical protein
VLAGKSGNPAGRPRGSKRTFRRTVERKNDKEIGYIKKVHSRIFYEPGAETLKFTVKAVDSNG